MAEAVKVLRSELEKGAPTPEVQAELDIRTEKIGKGELKDEQLFDPEPDKKPEEKPEEKKEEKKEEKTGELSDAELLDAEEGTLSDEQKTRKGELAKAKEAAEGEAEDTRILEAKEEDLDDKGKARKAELIKAKEGQQSEEEKAKAITEEVKAYATEHKVSEEDARKDLESIGKIVENSKGDARIIAKSYHHMQRLQARTAEELKTLKNTASFGPAAKMTSENVEKAIEAGKITIKGKSATKEQIIESYRDLHKDITDDMEDDKVFKLIVKDMKTGLDSRRQGDIAQMGAQAKEKKAKLIDSLSESEKKLMPEMQPILDGFTDRQIMNENFSLTDLVLVTKGRNFEKATKDADAAGFTRGIEFRRIVGEFKGPAEGKSRTKSTGGKTSLTEAEKREAEEKFATNDIPVKRKYELFKEILDHRKEMTEKEKKEKK